MQISILLLGLVVGMQHAFEADHLAAVSSLVSRGRRADAMTRRGALWGVGHTVSLLLIAGCVLVLGWRLPASFETALEAAVGLLLLGLGVRVLHRLWRDRVHVHAHEHDGEGVHLHAHSHRHDNAPHSASAHDHEHPEGAWPVLLVGLTHGAAGSAALIVFVAAQLATAWAGLVYVLLFGIGSIVGMATLTAIVALPLRAAASGATWLHRGLQTAIGAITVVIGARLILLHLG
ncbi:MAG: urease accessory protein [Acidobacteria bacterium]|nr:MAG: urease accessory protein [Acidobacteriota bacterium]